jgi:hypothetical protein
VIEEVVQVYRVLAKSRPDACAPDLARSLTNQARCLSDLGRGKEALAASEEAVRRLAPYFLARPDAFRDLMRPMVGTYIHCVREEGGEPDMTLLMPMLDPLQEHTGAA